MTLKWFKIFICNIFCYNLVPSKPEHLKFVISTTTSITLQWDDLPGTAVETYTVIQDGVEVMTGINTNMATIDGLTSNTNYRFQVKANNNAGDGQASYERILATSTITL